MPNEPRTSRGELLYPAPGYHSYPPRRPRFPGPRRRCTHCELVSETSSRECPVCAAPFERPGRLARVLAVLRGD